MVLTFFGRRFIAHVVEDNCDSIEVFISAKSLELSEEMENMDQKGVNENEQRPHDETIASLFAEKTAHLKDHEFIKIDREMLQMIGIKNKLSQKKDKHGNVKLDKKGNPKIKDTRHDFNNAIKFLRKTHGFIEGTSFDDANAHFILQKTFQNEKITINGGQNRQDLWVRKDMLNKWVQFAKFPLKKTNQTENVGIYFINMEGNMKMFKIGYTSNLNTRLVSLQIGNPFLLQVYKTIANVDKETETKLHHIFKKYHIRGEWFAITPDMIESVCKTIDN